MSRETTSIACPCELAGQYLLASFFGKNNTVVLLISTLIVASLAIPLRRRMQALVDRRFYRSKYDAARVVARFSETLRHEVDLNQLYEQLLAVVQETIQPAHVSLWIFQAERINTFSLQTSALPPATAGENEQVAEYGA